MFQTDGFSRNIQIYRFRFAGIPTGWKFNLCRCFGKNNSTVEVMTKKTTKDFQLIPDDTIIEIIAKGGGKVFIFDIRYKDYLKMERKKGYTYQAYEKGRSAYKEAIRMEYYKK